MLDIHTIGAGGGSIAWITPSGALAVGPRSAGAEPGPVCYGRGGQEPTVTDANLVLGCLPAALLGGEIALDVGAARRAIEERIATPLGLDLVDAASGIIDIVNNTMVGAIRAVSIARGLDPRDFALVAFGGAGPLHAPALAEALGIRTVVVPRRPGVLSTEGLLRTDLRNDYIQTCARTAPDYDLPHLNAILAELERRAHGDLDREGIPPERRHFVRGADVRYRHQGYELSVPLPDGPLTRTALAAIEELFHQEHRRLYTYDLRGQTVELVNLRIAATGVLPHAERGAGEALPASSVELRARGERRLYFGSEHGWQTVACYARDALAPGVEMAGPLAVDQEDTTTVVGPGRRLLVDVHGNLIIRLAAVSE